MTESTAAQRASKQADKDAIREFQAANFPETELTELRRRINATKCPERETVTDATQGEILESGFADSVCSCGCSRGIRADSRATRLQRTCDTISDEEFAATTARKMAVPSAYRQLRNPIMPSTENIRAGMEHFSDHCATCHSNDGGGDTLFRKGLYPKPPDMRAAGTQNKSDGELYYTIENGVRLSGMPAFGEAHSAAQTWRLVLFIRQLPQITAEELNEIKGLNPKTEADRANF